MSALGTTLMTVSLQSMLLVKLEALFRKKGSWLYLTKNREKTNANIQLIWLKHSTKAMNFLDKCLKKRLCQCFLQYPQTKTILSNLNEFYTNFKSKYVSASIDFSKFCELQPKWCVLAESSGTHSVRFCAYHQNMKLFLAPLNVTYLELSPLIVCDINNKESMVHRCPSCPESNTLF